jgi:hypothetical protein
VAKIPSAATSPSRPSNPVLVEGHADPRPSWRQMTWQGMCVSSACVGVDADVSQNRQDYSGCGTGMQFNDYVELTVRYLYLINLSDDWSINLSGTVAVPRSRFSRRKPMSVFSSVFVGLIAFDALLFVSLMFYRRDRPAARLRLFRWVLHTNSRHRASRHSHIPA